MAVNACPTCSAPIDPTRAPVARVRNGKVVTFCSLACAERNAEAERSGQASTPINTAERQAAAVKAAESALAVASPGYPPHRTSARASHRRRIIALSSAMLVGGMVITIISAFSPSTPTDVRAAASINAPASSETTPQNSAQRGSNGAEANVAASAAATASDSAAEIGDHVPDRPRTPEALFDAAETVLTQLVASPSLRVQRIAAMAWSRLGRESAGPAIERLATLLAAEASELGRIEIAYALARAGDERGIEVLRDSLAQDRRDIRLDAARALVQLKDDSGNKVLKRMLKLRNHRLGAAGLLAHLGNEDGIEALRETLNDKDASKELAMRAAVALGRAGDESVRPRLLDILGILEDGQYHVGAADALATLGDRAALPALKRQLTLPALRVRAALGLRRLGESVELDDLAAALDDGGDAARVSAAEAILILTGPKALAEFD